MKILISAYACDPTQGSEAACGWNWAYHTALQGHEVWCLTKVVYRKNILRRMAQDPIKNLHFVFVKTFLWLEYLKRKYHYPVVYPHYIIWQYFSYRRAKVLHRKISFDLVHHASYGSLQLGSHLWKLNLPFVFGPIGGGQKVPDPLKQYLVRGTLKDLSRSRISNLLLYRFKNTQKALKSARLVLTYNQETYDLAKQMGATEVKLMLDGAISEDAIPTTYPKRPTQEIMQVLWVGRLIPDKGLSLVIEVFKTLNNTHPIHLNVIGGGRLRNYYQRSVNALGLSDTITFHGKLPYHALKQHYINSDVFMYCGLRNTLGIQVLEAMGYGLPLVTLNLHGIINFIPEDTGISVELMGVEQTVDSLRQALIALYSDAAWRESLGSNAYAYAKTQTWSAKVKDVSRQYYQYVPQQKSLTL